MVRGRTRELLKFGMYCSLPVAASVVYGRPETMNEIVKAYNFIVYPASDRRIQTMSRQEFQDAVLEESKRIREEQQVGRARDKEREPGTGERAARPWYRFW